MPFRTTTSIVSNPSGTPDAIQSIIQAEADVILTALAVGYTSYHLQRKQEVIFTAKDQKDKVATLLDAVSRIKNALALPDTKMVDATGAPMKAPASMDQSHTSPNYIQGVYLMAGDSVPRVDTALGKTTKSDATTGMPVPILSKAGQQVYQAIVSDRDKLYNGPGAYTGMADDNLFLNIVDGREIRGKAVPPEMQRGPDPVVLLLPDGREVLKSGIQQLPNGIQVRRISVPSQPGTMLVQKRYTPTSAWEPAEGSLYTEISGTIGPAEGPFPTAQVVMGDGWSDKDQDLEKLHPRWNPASAHNDQVWGILTPDRKYNPMPSYIAAPASPVNLDEIPASEVAERRGGLAGYVHGMVQAIYAAYEQGPTYRPYEISIGDVTPKLASCFLCATFMDAAGYPANAVHLGSSDSWTPLYGYFDKHPTLRESVLLRKSPAQVSAQSTMEGFNRHWRDRCFTYLFLGLGLLSRGQSLFHLAGASEPQHPTNVNSNSNTAVGVNDSHKPALHSVVNYLMENIKPDFAKMAYSDNGLESGAFDTTGVASTIILDALTPHNGGQLGDITDRVSRTLPKAVDK